MFGPLGPSASLSQPFILALLAGLSLSSPGWTFDPDGEPTTESVLERMMEMDRCTTPALRGYTSIRHYHLENKRLGKTASMTVKLTFRYPGHKEFQVLSEQGSAIIRKRVLRKLLESELEASSDALREAPQITPRNYSFRLTGIEDLDGREAFVLEAIPKASNRYLFRGKVWVDADDYSIARVEGSPARNPSIWIRKTTFVHQYGKFGQFWLPVSNRSQTDVLIFGRTDLTIEYSDYVIETETSRSNGEACR